VTFLFTDIEGSTVRWELDPKGMSEGLTDHDVLLRSTIDAHGGVVFSTGGDGFGAAFADAVSALRAAVDAQDRVRLPVRMGLHTGTAEERDGNYFGRTLNRAARIMAAAHGGQIVVSDVTAALIRDDCEVTDLGEHRLAGVERVMRLWQVGGREFPPLRTSTAITGNLPTPLDSFVGRIEELDVLSRLMKTQRIVTVVGVGGMGKTRLVIEVCHREQSDSTGDVWFVDLAMAQSDGAVVEEVASLFGVQAAPGRSVEDRLIESLEPRTAVLIFDNCEHVMRPAAGLIDRLLHACPTLKIVATSREALMLRGEHVMALGPLSMGDDSCDEVADAVALFVDRLSAESGPITIGDDDRAAVMEICRRLDGMPLAIELAAARARTLGVTGVLARLGERLRLLSGGWRTAAGRQHTLSATLDWSYVLLDEREQVMFDRLAVFVGWFTLDDAVAVAGHPPLDELDVLDALSGLVDKSMCTVDVGATPTRYRYLETMRSYGRDHLSRSGMLAEYRNRHVAHLAASARLVREALVGPDELEASRHAERLTADLRAALGWAVDQYLDEVIDAVAALAPVMGVRGSYEIRGWCFDLRDDLHDQPRVQAAASHHALYSKGDLTEARRVCRRLLEISSDSSIVAWMILGSVEFNEGHFDQAVDCHTRAYEIGEAHTDDLFLHALAPTLLAITLAVTGRDASELAEQALDRARTLKWPTGLAFAHCAAGQAKLYTDPVASLEEFNRAVAIAVEVGSRQAEALGQTHVIYFQSALLPRAELAAAWSRLLRHIQQTGDMTDALITLSEVMKLLHGAGRLRTAALICGWLDGWSGRNPQKRGDHEAAIAEVRQSVGDQWDPLFRQGRSMTNAEVLGLACEELDTID
jgi:predicted ATPase